MTCGPALFACQCHGNRAPLRTQAEVDALHHEAVRRAHASGFAAAPVPAWVVAVLWPYAWRDEVAA